MTKYSDHTRQIISELASARIRQGISLRDLAYELNVYPNAIQQILNPDKNPSIENIVKVGNALGLRFTMSNTRNLDCTAKELVDLLAKERIYQEITTRELATLTGIVQPTICHTLSYQVVPRLDAFLKIADALNIELIILPEK